MYCLVFIEIKLKQLSPILVSLNFSFRDILDSVAKSFDLFLTVTYLLFLTEKNEIVPSSSLLVILNFSHPFAFSLFAIKGIDLFSFDTYLSFVILML